MGRSGLYTRRDVLFQAGAWGFWALALTGCSSCSSEQASESAEGFPVLQEGRLTIASDLMYPPMVLSQRRKPTGFGVDVCDNLAAGLDLVVDPVDCGDSQEVFRALLEEKSADLGSTVLNADEVPSGLSLCYQVLAAQVSAVVRPPNNPRDIAELNNAQNTILVEDHGWVREWAEKNLGDAKLEYSSDPQEILSSVREGRPQAAILEQVVALYYLTTIYTTLDVAFSESTGAFYTFIAPSQSEALIQAVKGELERLKDDGVIASLESRWFGEVISDS